LGEGAVKKTVLVAPEPTEEQKEECPGSVIAPKAAKGYLCVYMFFGKHPYEVKLEAGYVTEGGAFLIFPGVTEGEPTELAGSWAVTAE
jgi:hypothetical protein